MKSRASCYDPAFSRMEVRRFAPVWVLYPILLFLSIALMSSGWYGYPDGIINCVQEYINVMALLNMIYAAVLVQLLFGDLYSTRLCYAIHSMPVTRGGWFGTQVILGLFASLIPNCIGAGIYAVMVPSFKIVTLWWLAAVEMQFLFFFGAAVFSAIAAGNRFGMLVLYAMINFFYVAVAWFWMKVLVPLIYAMYMPNVGLELCPVWEMAENPVFEITREKFTERMANGMRREPMVIAVKLTSHFWGLLIYAAVGCALIWVAMRMYRRRKLESAGELLAFPQMDKPILVLFTLCAGASGHLFAFIFRPIDVMEYLFLFFGLIAGYFACLMLQKRQVNVFQWKNIAPLCVIIASVLAVVTLTGLDVLGITYRTPKAEDVASVSVNTAYCDQMSYVTSDPDEIRQVIDLQLAALEEHREIEASRPLIERILGSEENERSYTTEDGDTEYCTLLFIIYQMKNGSEMKRCYFIHESSPGVPALRKMLSSPEVVFSNYNGGLLGEGFEDLLSRIEEVNVSCGHEATELSPPVSRTIRDKEILRGLLEAMFADCESGGMGQEFFLHKRGYYPDNMNIYLSDVWPYDEANQYIHLGLYADCENTYNWLVENGYHKEITEETFIFPGHAEGTVYVH